MTQHTDTKSIEAGIDRDRAALARTLGGLQDRLSVETLAQDALGMVRGNAASLGRSIDTAVRANPLALALAGAGIAWLVFGGRKSPEMAKDPEVQRWEDEGGTPVPSDSDVSGSFDRASDHAWSDEINGLRARASAALKQIERETGSHVRDLSKGAARALDQTRDIAAERAAVLADFAAGMKKGFAHGLDDLAGAARERVVAARQKAYAAGLRTETQAREAGRKAGRMIDDHPMIAGAVAFALGAALAASLPRTRVENRTLGAERDRLLDQAAKALQTEIARAGRVASGVADELATSASAAVSAVSDGVTETVKSVKDRALTEAAKSKS